MLQLTKRTEYGLLAMVHMADCPGEVQSVRRLCEQYPLPKRLLAEVLKDLARLGLVVSHRGTSGGYELARPAERITLADVVQALEGAPELTNCDSSIAQGSGGCEVRPTCRIRSPIQRVRATLWRTLEQTTLREIASPPPPSNATHAIASPSPSDTASDPRAHLRAMFAPHTSTRP